MNEELINRFQNDLYKIRNMLDLCMESIGLGNCGDAVEATIWAAHDMLKKLEEDFDKLTFQEIRSEQEEDDWKEIDELVKHLQASKRADDGEVELAVQDGEGDDPYETVFRKVTTGKAATSSSVKKGKKK